MEIYGRAKELWNSVWYPWCDPPSVQFPSGTDLFDVPAIIFGEAEKNQCKSEIWYDLPDKPVKGIRPQCCKARCMCEDIAVYITDQAELYFG